MQLKPQISIQRATWRGLLLAAATLLASCHRTSSEPLTQEAYVWQRVWTPAVTEAVTTLPPEVQGLRVLIAQSDAEHAWREFELDAGALGRIIGPLTAVIRIDGQRPLTDPRFLIDRIAAIPARVGASSWLGVEVDYDCPTRTLPEYARFLSDLRARLPANTALSITVLPTWMSSSELPTVLNAVDRSVLQVHSVSDPHQGLFNGDQAHQWIEQFAELSPKPFDVAIPNYGSRVRWDSVGRLQSVTSEQEDIAEGAGHELTADPIGVARLLHQLRTSHPRLQHGIVWFRLPVGGDQRIWSQTTWRSVMTGQPLRAEFEISAELDAQGAYQVRLLNTGTLDAKLPNSIIAPTSCTAADGEGGYALSHEPGRVVWKKRLDRQARVGETVRVGWTRCDPRGGLSIVD
jgi:hypothetical protein